MRRLLALLLVAGLLAPSLAWAAINPGKVAVYDATLTNAAVVTNAAPGGSDYGLVTRIAGTAAVTQSGSWSIAATQSGTWTVRLNDSAGSGITLTSTTGGTGIPVTVQNPTDAGNGATTATTSRVTLSSDSTGQVAITPIASLLTAATLLSTSGDNVVVSGTANQRVRVYSMDVYCNGANTVLIKSGTTNSPTTLWHDHALTANSGVILDERPSKAPWFTTRNNATATDNSLVLNLSGTAPCAVTVYYTVAS